MPEIGEVARIVHFIRKHLVGKTLAVVKALHDENVFGKVGTSAAEFEKTLRGKTVVDAGQQGKYFWLIMSSPPHPLCHFGMAGWFEIRYEDTWYKKLAQPKDHSIWPPKYWRFSFETAEEPKCEAAFVDFRRFGRVRLVDCPAEEIRRISPLKENGPDPVIDREMVTEEWLAERLSKKKLHVKTFLLDQANISGIGNWVGDEILYQAAIHPETYTQSLSTAQISRLYTSLHEVTSLSVATLADPDQFPESWLFKHRWGKGKKDSTDTLPNGERITFLNVGGRTTAFVASVQKKTGGSGAAKGVEDGNEPDEAIAEGEGGEEREANPTSRENKKKADIPVRPKPADTESKFPPARNSTVPAQKVGRTTRAVKQGLVPDSTAITSSTPGTKTKRNAPPAMIEHAPRKRRNVSADASSVSAEDINEVPSAQLARSQSQKTANSVAKSSNKNKPKPKKANRGVVGSSSSAADKNEEEDLWEGRRRSRRVSGRNHL